MKPTVERNTHVTLSFVTTRATPKGALLTLSTVDPPSSSGVRWSIDAKDLFSQLTPV